MQLISPSHFISYFLFCLASILLCGCSPPKESTTLDQEQTDDVASEDEDVFEDDISDAERYVQQLLSDGWRYGKLRIQFDVHQKCDVEHVQPATRLTGPTFATAKTETVFSATSEQAVLVAADLSVTVPEDGTEDDRAAAFREKPFYISETLPDATLVSNIDSKHTKHVLEPESNIAVEITINATEHGELEKMWINDLHPSLYGQGWELNLDLLTNTSITTHQTSIPPDGKPPIAQTDTHDNEELFQLSFYPALNRHGLNDYPYFEGEDFPPGSHAKTTQYHQDWLAHLHRINKGEAGILSSQHIGLETKATKDSLVLDYTLSGHKQIPYGIANELCIPYSVDMMKVTVTITAD